MSIKQAIMDDIKAAMKAQDKEKLSTLRLVSAAFKQVEVDERKELSDDDVMTILTKMVKQRRESITQFTQGNRMDLVEVEEKELAIIMAYLPTPLSETEISEIIKAAIAESGASSIKDMAKVMAIAKPKLQARADMSKVSGIIKSLLA